MIPSFELFGFKIFTYPLLMGAAWGIGSQVAKRLNDFNSTKFKSINFYLLGVFLSSWLGAKLFYLFTVEARSLKGIAAHSEFWLGGGFVFYGGLLAGLLFSILFAIKTKQELKAFNIFIPGLCIGHAVGRLGCLMAGCCYGIDFNGPLSVHLHGADRFPVQLLEAIVVFTFGILSLKERWQGHQNLALGYLAFYSIGRFIFEFLRGDAIRGIWFGFISTSQIVSLFISGLVMAFLFYRSRAVSNLS
ncbi:MAG: hypothetical protein CME64_02390 [Halobacteriovoraceae bacterium]|nr:hypothetical protein [Halobacteriovoraceae bacterium]|tara:strand:- start:42780 stop:43517 length:738 start_codon:yes stop_codon:yes gene_type:complete